ncbi:MAG: PTS sugar transporter subunit IIB [candidate division WOR-3 bacterium]
MILRVDDRYVHGQVIAGWVRPLGINYLILANNEIAGDDWAKNTYNLAVPENIKFTVTELDNLMNVIDPKINKTMILVGSIKDAVKLIEDGLNVKEVDLGCLSFDDGKCEVCSYIYLSKEDIEYIKILNQKGIKVLARALPNCPTTDVGKFIKEMKD